MGKRRNDLPQQLAKRLDIAEAKIHVEDAAWDKLHQHTINRGLTRELIPFHLEALIRTAPVDPRWHREHKQFHGLKACIDWLEGAAKAATIADPAHQALMRARLRAGAKWLPGPIPYPVRRCLPPVSGGS